MSFWNFPSQLDRIEAKLDALTARSKTMSAELDALTAQVAQNTNAEQSAITLLNNLHQLLIDAGTDPAKLGAITSTLKTSADALAAAVVANTPAAP